jgi:N-acylglucosamine-6-phosphate 2-epimerase
MNDKIRNLQGKLIVSCQALDYEPLHSSFIMGRMAVAAQEGGAGGIRANTVEDIREIKKNVDLPIIGILKRDYPDSSVFITPTMKEIDELMEVKPDIIALDATNRIRPGNLTLDELYKEIRAKYPDQPLFADCSSVEEALHADELGFEFVGPTLVGYTESSKGVRIEENDFEIIKTIVKNVKGKVIAEGNIDTPEKAKRVMELGCYCVVVGSAITRPQLITKKFAAAVNSVQR